MKKAQTGIIGLIFLVLVFIIIWFVWLGGVIADFGELSIQAGGLTGLEAFFYANLNLWIFIGLILGLMAFIYIGGRT